MNARFVAAVFLVGVIVVAMMPRRSRRVEMRSDQTDYDDIPLVNSRAVETPDGRYSTH